MKPMLKFIITIIGLIVLGTVAIFVATNAEYAPYTMVPSSRFIENGLVNFNLEPHSLEMVNEVGLKRMKRSDEDVLRSRTNQQAIRHASIEVYPNIYAKDILDLFNHLKHVLEVAAMHPQATYDMQDANRLIIKLSKSLSYKKASKNEFPKFKHGTIEKMEDLESQNKGRTRKLNKVRFNVKKIELLERISTIFKKKALRLEKILLAANERRLAKLGNNEKGCSVATAKTDLDVSLTTEIGYNTLADANNSYIKYVLESHNTIVDLVDLIKLVLRKQGMDSKVQEDFLFCLYRLPGFIKSNEKFIRKTGIILEFLTNEPVERVLVEDFKGMHYKLNEDSKIIC